MTGLAFLLAACLAFSDAVAQPGGGQAGPGGRGGRGAMFGGGMFGGGGLSSVLMREDVRNELELLDGQMEELRELAEKRGEQMREMFSGMQDLSREERMQRFQELREKMQDAQKDAEKEIERVLMPHQVKRARQLAFQLRMRGGVGRAMMSDEIAEEFGITDSQREKIREKAQQLEEELRKKMTQLREEAQKELLNELTPQQQAKWKEKVGEPFEFQDQMRRFGAGNAPGGRGPRGGGR
jgi:hypothetical protein